MNHFDFNTLKKSHGMGTDTQTERQTYGHRDSMKESAKGRFFEKDIRENSFSLEHPQGVGIVGIVGTVGIVRIVGIEFYRPQPRPITPSVLVDI